MPTLNWIGKDKVINHHLDVPYRILDKQYTYNAETNSENKIIHGDNLEALKSLLPQYEGRIKCIYIDPPYNTGNEGWVYNDNVNDPKIKKWLGEVVGKESEDLTRHDKWLCMMYPRLKLLHRLLANDGAIFISIDDNEQANLRLMCDEIFGSRNCVGNLIQNKMNAKNDTINIQRNHEFILVYRKTEQIKENSKTIPTLIHRDYKIKDIIQEGDRFYYLNDSITTRGDGGTLKARPNLGYTIYFNPKTSDKIALSDYDKELAKELNDIDKVYNTNDNLVKEGYIPIRPPKVRGKLGCWTWDINKFENEKDSIIITGKTPSFSVKKRTFVEKEEVYTENRKLKYNHYSEGNTKSILDFSTNEGTNLLNQIMGISNVFDNPKNFALIKYLISLATDKDSIILDSFAGSGTTAHAVLNLNQQDRGNRKFILVEMEDYADSITAERVKRVIDGYGEGKSVEGTGGDFSYYELGQPMFIENDYLNEELPLQEIHRYIWYTETAKPFDESAKEHLHLLGTNDNSSYYFFYEKDSLTTLNYDYLHTIKQKSDTYVIYADNCVLPKEFLAKNNIIFKKIPRDITRF